MPEVEGSKPSKKKFKAYPIGYFHIDIAEVQTAEGKLYLYVAIDRTSKFAFVRLVKKTGRTSASVFLEALASLGTSSACSVTMLGMAIFRDGAHMSMAADPPQAQNYGAQLGYLPLARDAVALGKQALGGPAYLSSAVDVAASQAFRYPKPHPELSGRDITQEE